MLRSKLSGAQKASYCRYKHIQTIPKLMFASPISKIIQKLTAVIHAIDIDLYLVVND